MNEKMDLKIGTVIKYDFGHRFKYVGLIRIIGVYDNAYQVCLSSTEREGEARISTIPGHTIERIFRDFRGTIVSL